MMNEKTPGNPAGTYGLVLCGGQSSRMGTDKSMLVYHAKPQRYHLYELMRPFCKKVFISCKHSHATGIAHGYAVLTDDHLYNNTGPAAALLTAFERFPGGDILLIGCDYPFLTATELEYFFKMIPAVKPVAFYNEEADLPEPLLAWYPYSCYGMLKEQFRSGRHSLKQFLQENGSIRYIPLNKDSIQSVDTEEEYSKTKKIIRDKNGG